MAQTSTVLTVFGTRPEVIKLAPVLRALASEKRLRLVQVCTGQQGDLTPAFIESFDVFVDHDLRVMLAGQPLNALLSSVVAGLDPLIERYAPRAVIVQGDTVSALGAALAARLRQVPVVHVEAGLRTGDVDRPFPEESARRMISIIADLHCAPTERNRQQLLAEGVGADAIVVTGNPVVDAVGQLVSQVVLSPLARETLEWAAGGRLVLVTAHRRENFGPRLRGYLEVLRAFGEAHDDVRLAVPVHPNPAAGAAVREVFGNAGNARLLPPLDYADFIGLLLKAWLVVSDSGGLQEEAATLGKPLVVIRELTERPEAIAAGVARLAPQPEDLARVLEAAASDDTWHRAAAVAQNPFGHGDSGARIADAVTRWLFGGVRGAGG